MSGSCYIHSEEAEEDTPVSKCKIKMLVDQYPSPKCKPTLALISTFMKYISIYRYFLKISQSPNRYVFTFNLQKKLRLREVKSPV